MTVLPAPRPALAALACLALVACAERFAADFEAETQLIDFYRNEVLLGPEAFLEVAQGFEDYERAMRRKLERELSVPVFGALTPARRPRDPG